MLVRIGPTYDPGGATGAGTPSPAPAAADATPTATPSGASAIPASTEPAATATPPRDPKGRFTKEAIYAAAGETLPAAAPTPQAPAAEVAPAAAAMEAPTLEAELAKIDAFVGTAPATPAPPQTPAPAPPPQYSQAPEVQQLAHWAQNPEIARAAVQSAQSYVHMNNELARGNVDGFLGMLTPEMQGVITEHIYKKNAEQFARRYVDETDGKTADPRVTTLERQYQSLIAELQGQKQQQTEAQQQYQQQQAQAQLTANFRANMDSLFDLVKLKDNPNRGWLESAIMREVFSDPKTAAQIQAGQFGAVGAKFRELYPKFRPLLNAATVPPQAAAPTAAQQLMTAASGTSAAPAPDPNAGIKDGRMTSDWWASRKGQLKKLMTGS